MNKTSKQLQAEKAIATENMWAARRLRWNKWKAEQRKIKQSKK